MQYLSDATTYMCYHNDAILDHTHTCYCCNAMLNETDQTNVPPHGSNAQPPRADMHVREDYVDMHPSVQQRYSLNTTSLVMIFSFMYDSRKDRWAWDRRLLKLVETLLLLKTVALWVIRLAGAYSWQPYHLHVPIVLKFWSLNLLEPSCPVQACNGMAFTFYYRHNTVSNVKTVHAFSFTNTHMLHSFSTCRKHPCSNEMSQNKPVHALNTDVCRLTLLFIKSRFYPVIGHECP